MPSSGCGGVAAFANTINYRRVDSRMITGEAVYIVGNVFGRSFYGRDALSL